MEMKTTIKYEEEYLPTKRHRIPRIREVEDSVTVELREVKKDNAPIAVVVTNYRSYLDKNGQDFFGLRDTPYFAVDGQLYSEKRDMSGALDRGPYSIEMFLKDIVRVADCSRHGHEKSREDIIRSLNELMDSHILIDGVVYEKRGEPRYVVNTFGLGHNHGGTSMFIDEHYNPNISKNNYFSALQREEAIAYANKVAEARGDTESIGTFGDINIEVYMPEMIRCNPALEHGDGSPWLNSLEDLVRASKSSVEAGLFVIGAVSGQLSDKATASLTEQILPVITDVSQEKERQPGPIEFGIDDNWLHRGQKVKLLNKSFLGQVGTIQSFIWNTGEYIVTLENGHDVPFRSSEIEKIECNQLPLSEQIRNASLRVSDAQHSTKQKEPIQTPEI